MKNTIMYYYDLNDVILSKINGINYVRSKNKIYIFSEIYNINEIYEIYNLLSNKKNYYKIIKNRMGDIVTPYNNKNYILMEKETKKISNIPPIIVKNTDYLLDRSNWYELWRNKNDYYEYQMNHIRGKYKIIDESIDYYIGIAENAISYISYNIKKINNVKMICHKRINADEYFNPLNCVIDYQERDIGEYLKYIFWSNEYKKINLNDFFAKKINHNIINYNLLYARILYPTEYFDKYDQIVNSLAEAEKLNSIIKRQKEYELYINNIYEIISKYSVIPKIDWL